MSDSSNGQNGLHLTIRHESSTDSSESTTTTTSTSSSARTSHSKRKSSRITAKKSSETKANQSSKLHPNDQNHRRFEAKQRRTTSTTNTAGNHGRQFQCICLGGANNQNSSFNLVDTPSSLKLEHNNSTNNDDPNRDDEIDHHLGHYSTSYEGDDEDQDETFFFPCHQTFDNCQTGQQLSDQHYEYLQLSHKSFYIIKYPKMFERIIESMFKELRTNVLLNRHCDHDSNDGDADDGLSSCDRVSMARGDPSTNAADQYRYHLSINFKPIIALVKKLTIICSNEKRNSTILSATEILNILMKEILFLIQEVPEKQSVYLEPLLKFALTLCNNKVTGTNLKQLFNIIKNENTDLKIVLEQLDRLLENQQQRQATSSRRQLSSVRHSFEANSQKTATTSERNNKTNHSSKKTTKAAPHRRHDFGSALVEAGGIESFLIFFAEVIRRVQMDPYTHSLAFSILLRMSQTNAYHLGKFLDELNGLKMAEFILAHPKCSISKRLLESYLEFCLVKQRSSFWLIKSPNLVYSLMNCWRAWHKDLRVARVFYKRLIRLLEPASKHQVQLPAGHPLRAKQQETVQAVNGETEIYYVCHNFDMINNAGGIDILMGILRECLVPLDEFVPAINHEIVKLIVQLISMLIKDPPGLDVLLDIMEFLLFLHPDPKSYVEVAHDKTAYLHRIDGTNGDQRIVFDDDEDYDETASSVPIRTPASDGSRSIQSSCDNIGHHHKPRHCSHGQRRRKHRDNLGRPSRRSMSATSGSSSSGDSGDDSNREFDEEDEINFMNNNNRNTFRSSSNNDEDELFRSSGNRISEKCNQNLAELISEINVGCLMKNMPTATGYPAAKNKVLPAQTNRQQQQADEGDDNDLLAAHHKCSNRNFAISIISDLLASIVKRTSIESMKVLSEALQKSIIDPRKLIILANNNATLVRERVLRLFLYCIKSCYSLPSLSSLLNKYEQQQQINASTKQSQCNFKVCLPMQLMARQLLKYPVTNKMMQLCYAIIVGVNDSGISEQMCLTFDIDTANNSLQMNALVLLIQLMTQLQDPREISQALDFVYTYLQRLTQLGEESTVLAIIKSELVDSMMKLYFVFVENKTTLERQNQEQGRNSANEEGEDEEDLEAQSSEPQTTGAKIKAFEQVKLNLDRMLLFIVRYYLQNQSTTGEAIQSIDELLRYFDLLNTFIANQNKCLIRDCQVRILGAMLKYCKHYERCSKQKVYGGKVDYYLKSFFKNNQLNRFDNTLSLSYLTNDEFDLLLNAGNDSGQETTTILSKSSSNSLGSSSHHGQVNGALVNGASRRQHTNSTSTDDGECNGQQQQPRKNRTTSTMSDEDNVSSTTDSTTSDSLASRSLDEQQQHQQQQQQQQRQAENELKEISVSDVVQRFKSTMDFIVNFIITRPAGAIPSPAEREFVINFVRLLARFAAEHQHSLTSSKLFSFSQVVRGASGVAGVQNNPKCHWSMMLAELDPSISGHFTRLILYLLSTCESMNIDERKYYAHKLLDIFTVDELLNLIHKSENSNNSTKSTYKILLVFLKDLIDRSSPLLLINQSLIENGLATRRNCADGGVGPADGLDEEDELIDEMEIKLRRLVKGIEYELGMTNLGGKQLHQSAQDKQSKRIKYSNSNYLSPDADKIHSEIWLSDLRQLRLDSGDKLRLLKLKIQQTSITSSGQANNGYSAASSALSSLSLSSALIGGTDSGISTAAASLGSDESNSKLLDEAVSITRDVVNDKNEQRKTYLEDVKQGKVYNYHVRQQWLSLIISHTHERAIWFMEKYYPKSWELNPVEGPSRTRRRLRPCKLTLESRFLRKSAAGSKSTNNPLLLNQNHLGISNEQSLATEPTTTTTTTSSTSHEELFADDWYNQYSPHPLCSLVINNEQSMDSNELKIRMFTTDKIHFNCDCSIIRPNEVCDGEVSIASWCIHFIGEKSDSYQKHLTACNSATMPGGLPAGGSPLHKLIRRHIGSGASVAIDPNGMASGGNKVGRSSKFTPTTTTPASRRAATFVSTTVEDLWFDEIVEIWDRRYQLQDVGLEIFLTNNMTYLLSFKNNHDREEFKQNLMREQHKMINLQRFNLTTSLNRLTQFWRDGKMTNFDYLTCLNKLAGRSFNDLMQYPIFPFVLSNYTSESLDLTSSDNFRKLKRPMAIQEPDRETNFIENYKFSQSSNISVGPCGLTKPYHYSNHYSNSATVLHFLVRLPPFTQMLIQYQDNNFDQPDRTFHSVANTWQLITRDSNTDFKELIPEFFFLPEMFINIENFELGRKQNNELVDDVRLPAWCPNSDARLFTLIHRQALESPYVSESLHHWIDLIFGFKQTGKAAVDAINVFHPATYYGGIDFNNHQLQQAPTTTPAVGSSVSTATPIGSTLANMSSAASKSLSNYSSDNISTADTTNMSTCTNSSTANQQQQQQCTTGAAADSICKNTSNLSRKLYHQVDIERSALETMIKTYGQMPRQLFSQPMKQRSLSTFVQQLNENKLDQQQQQQQQPSTIAKPPEPLKRIKGLRWGNYVGSPNDSEIIAVKHKMIGAPSPARSANQQQRSRTGGRNKSKSPKQKYHLCLLSNGDIVILRNNTSLMLDYRADRKSGGTYQLSVPSARYTARRAGLSNVARMNLFSNMIISRQQFSFLEPIYSSANNQLDTLNTASSTIVSFSSASRVRFSPGTLSLVSWCNTADGDDDPGDVIRIRHPATSCHEPSKPLVQGNTIVDKMSTCCSIPELNLLLVGYNSGSICAHIVSTSYETQLAANNQQLTLSRSSSSTSLALNAAAAAAAAATSASNNNNINYSAAPSAVHFLHTTSTGSADRSLGPGKLVDNSLTGEPMGPVSLAGKTLQSIRAMNRASRWLYCHSRRVNCIKINVSFGIVVTGSDDGTSVVWDLNSLTYVRTIDYKYDSLRMQRSNGGASSPLLANPDDPNHECHWTFGHANKQRILDYLCCCQMNKQQQTTRPPSRLSGNGDVDEFNQTSRDIQQCCICTSGISLVTISDTLGDIVTIKDISNRLAGTSENATTTTMNDNNNVGGPIAHGEKGYHSSASSSCILSNGGARSTSTSGGDDEDDGCRSSSGDSSDSLTSVLYVHTINGALVGFVNCHTKVTAVCYSNAPEGISVNVILVGLADGLIRLYSSWDLSRVKEFRVSGLCSPINSLLYSRDSQLLYVTYEDGQLVVLSNKKRKSSGLEPKELYL